MCTDEILIVMKYIGPIGFDPSLTGQFLPAGTCTLVLITWRFHIKSTAGIDVSMPAPSPSSHGSG